VTAGLDTRAGELYAPMGKVLPFRRRGDDGAIEVGRDAGRQRSEPVVVAGFASSREQFESLVSFMDGTDAAGLEHAELEERLDRDGRELLRRLLDDHLALRAIREQRLESVVGDDEVRRGRVERDHRRVLGTVFGEVTVSRMAYRAPEHRNLHPADAALNLPVERHSHGLRKLAAWEAARGSFDDAVSGIERACGQQLAKRQVEELAQIAAVDFEDFYQARKPARCKRGDLLVISADGKGIVMRPDALRPKAALARARQGPKHPQTRLASAEKSNYKRMAEIGAVYDATPVPRTAADIIASDEDTERDRTPGPVARNKWLTASIVNDAGTVIEQILDEAQRRDPKHQRTWVALVDGNNHQIQRIKAGAKARKVKVTIVVDFVHVLEYLWNATWCFHAARDPAAEQWVHRQATAVLKGRARRVAGQIRRKATNARLGPENRKIAEEAATYLSRKAPNLDYPTALKHGWPIATGIIEGACRHIVKDRMDITGARWGLTGAEAVLKLRAIKTNGDFDAYWRYHLEQERHHVHEARYHDHTIPQAA
jgi:Uncharacterised protein family (UPF0236)